MLFSAEAVWYAAANNGTSGYYTAERETHSGRWVCRRRIAEEIMAREDATQADIVPKENVLEAGEPWVANCNRP